MTTMLKERMKNEKLKKERINQKLALELDRTRTRRAEIDICLLACLAQWMTMMIKPFAGEAMRASLALLCIIDAWPLLLVSATDSTRLDEQVVFPTLSNVLLNSQEMPPLSKWFYWHVAFEAVTVGVRFALGSVFRFLALQPTWSSNRWIEDHWKATVLLSVAACALCGAGLVSWWKRFQSFWRASESVQHRHRLCAALYQFQIESSQRDQLKLILSDSEPVLLINSAIFRNKMSEPSGQRGWVRYFIWLFWEAAAWYRDWNNFFEKRFFLAKLKAHLQSFIVPGWPCLLLVPQNLEPIFHSLAWVHTIFK